MLACVCTAFLAAPAAVSGAIAANPSSALNLASQARSALQGGDLDTAIATYSEAIETGELPEKHLANAFINRGYAHQQKQDHDRAVEDYTAALAIDTVSGKLRATTLYNRGLSQQKLGHAAKAIEDFTSALFVDPEFAHAYYLRGMTLRDNGQLLFALSDFEKAIRFKHPQPYLVYYAEALAYETLHRLGDAQASLEKAIAANPSFEPARSKLAQLSVLPAVVDTVVEPNDNLVTASITAPEQVVRKDELPDAVQPPKKLAGDLPVQIIEAVPVKRAKLYNDRIPPEEGAQVAVIEPAAAEASDDTIEADTEPAQAEVKPEKEQIVAIEALPEEKDEAPADAQDESAPAPEAQIDAADNDTQTDDPQLAGWSVQLSSARDEKLAWGTWEKLKARHKSLSDLKPVVVRADLGKKGVYYRLRLAGFDNQDDAKSMCGKLKSRGLSCFVSKIDS